MKDEHSPSEWALRVLRWVCPERLYEGIEGDLIEEFERDLLHYPVRRARRRFAWNALRFLRAGIISRNKFSTSLLKTPMLQNYLSVTFRNLLRNKVFSAINIIGLGTGLAACLLIFQFVGFELSYDEFNEKFDRTYRVTNDRFQNGRLIQHGTIMYPTIGPTMAKDFPEIEEYTRIMPAGALNVKAEDRVFRGDEALFVDDHFLSVFTLPLLAGDKVTALKDPYAIVITEAIAKKYFGVAPENAEQAIGKVVYAGFDTRPYKVTGVLKAFPENSHIKTDVLVSYTSLYVGTDKGADESWTWSDMRHYLVLKPGADYKALESKFPAYSERYFKGDKVSGSVEKFYLQPLKRAHLYSDYEYDIAKTASGKAVWAMVIVAFFILFIAWINYINLTTSRALDRAKEVGMRKVMGAQRTQLIRQFIFESSVVSFFALAVAFALVLILQVPFNRIIGVDLSLWKMLSVVKGETIVLIGGVLVAGIFLSGFYPAFILSSYQPVTVLKGKFQRSSRGQIVRKSLVVFQFTASAALITGTLIVAKQLRFMNSMDLGISIRNTVVVQAPERTRYDSTFISRVEAYKTELLRLPEVVSAATSGNLPGDRLGRGFDLRLQEQPSTAHFTMSHLGADYSFFETYEIKMAAGRKFLPTDHNPDFGKINSVILNEDAIKILGIESPQAAIGKELVSNNNVWRIVGVIHSFHQESLKKPTEPLLILPTYSTYGPTSIKVKSSNLPATIASIEKIYETYFPDNSFEYFFMEDRYNHQYDDDNRFGKVISIFTLLAIIISSLGLIGLSSYTAIQRTKEIGIRKVLGASLVSIVSLLSADFIKLILLACVIALPLAWFPMHRWLEAYPYHTTINVMIFLIPVVAILAIAAVTMSFQVFRTARTNPAETLKQE